MPSPNKNFRNEQTRKTMWVFLIVCLLFVLAVKAWLLEIVRVPSASMSPNILPGDILLVEKWPFTLNKSSPERGEIVVFKNPQKKEMRLVKRVIGVSGDKILWSRHRIFLNGRLITGEPFSERDRIHLQEGEGLVSLWESVGSHSYLVQSEIASWEEGVELVTSPNKLIVFGDNRDYSGDSRAFGPVVVEDVVGRVRQILFSVESGSGRIRWERMGQVIP